MDHGGPGFADHARYYLATQLGEWSWQGGDCKSDKAVVICATRPSCQLAFSSDDAQGIHPVDSSTEPPHGKDACGGSLSVVATTRRAIPTQPTSASCAGLLPRLRGRRE